MMKQRHEFQRAARPGRSATRRPYVTLYLRPATEAALRAVRCDGQERRGGISRAIRIDSNCERYAALVAEFMPRLEEAQWCGMMDILNPGLTSEQFEKLRTEHLGICDFVRAAHARGVGDRWDYDREELEQDLGQLSDTTLYALVEVADRFWSSDLADGRTPRQRLQDCGANISG